MKIGTTDVNKIVGREIENFIIALKFYGHQFIFCL